MRFNEITEANILSRAKSQANRAVSNLRNRFSKPQTAPAQQVEPTMAPEEEPQFAAWKNARNPGAPAATSPQAAAPQPTTYAPQAPATGGTAGPARGGFLSGFAKGLGAPELANTINDYNASKVTKGAFPFPSAVPPQDAAMGNTPPPVNEPEPEEEPEEPASTGANAFGQMTKQLNVMPKTSTGGTLTNTPTGITHTASANNPNQPATAQAPVATTTDVKPAAAGVPNTNFGLRNIPPKKPAAPNFARGGQQTVAPTNIKYSGNMQKPAPTTPNNAKIPVGESIDIAETLWRKMKSKR